MDDTKAAVCWVGEDVGAELAGCLIKALRASKNDEERVIRSALDDIAAEIRQSDWEVKAGAVLKLIYLEMLGHPHLSQHAFPVIECMSSTRFHLKQIGYLAASQSFREGTEVLLLTNNLIKKDLTTPAPTPTTLLLTLASLPNLLLSSPQLVTDLHPELVRQLTSSRPVVRRSTILVLGKLWSARAPTVPISQEQIIEKLRERLADDDLTVVSAAVNVLLELASNSSNEEATALLALAPELFDLLTTSSNNWMLIKIIKTFTLLTPLEPRLVRKLLPPLRQLITSTSAMSLLYECINAVIVGGMLEGEGGDALAGTCVDKLASFLEDVDQNLRYMALLALVRLLPTHPGLVARHYDEILQCVDDADTTIRTQALNLVDGMVDRSNLQDIVSQLMRHLKSQGRKPKASTSAIEALTSASRGDSSSIVSSSSVSSSSPAYRRSLVTLIVTISTRSTYANVSNFPWLIDTLCSLASVSLAVPGLPENLLSDAIIDIAARAKAVRPYMAKRMAQLLRDEGFRANAVEAGGAAAGVLHAAAWIVGEYASELDDAQDLLEPLFDAEMLLLLPPSLAATLLHNGVKLLAHIAVRDEMALDLAPVKGRTLPCLQACARASRGSDIELVERASQLEAVVKIFVAAFESYEPPAPVPSQPDSEWANGDATPPPREVKPSDLLHNLFTGAYELNPVSAKAQSMVGLPEDLNLDAWIVPSAASLGAEWEQAIKASTPADVDEYGRARAMRGAVVEPEEQCDEKPRRKKGKSKRRHHGREDEGLDEDVSETQSRRAERLERQRDDPYYIDQAEDDIDSIPVVQLDLNLSGPPLTARKMGKSRDASPAPRVREPTPPPIFVDIEGELPPQALQRVKAAPTPVESMPESSAPEESLVDAPAVEVVKVKKRKDPNKVKRKKATDL